LGPWTLGGLFRWAQGTPFNVFADPTICNCPGNIPTGAPASLTGSPVGAITPPLAAPFQSVSSNFGAPVPNTLGILGRNALRGPNFANYDFSLIRSFVVHEQIKVQIRGEAYNITNSPHFANPIGNVNSSAFGTSIATLPYAPERRLQLA